MQQHIASALTQIPDDIARLAHEQQLGTPQTSYTVTKLVRGWRWLAFAIQFLLCCDGIIFAFIVIYMLLHGYKSITTIYPFIIIPLISSNIFLNILKLLNNAITIYTCEGGFILKQSAKKFRVIHWDEVESMRSTLTYAPGSFFSRHRIDFISCHDGYTLAFHGARKSLSELQKTLEEQLTRRCLPFLLADYQAGQTLHFGPLAVNRQGLNVRDTALAWEYVADISLVKDQQLVISQSGEQPTIWLTLPALKIPNLSLLLALFKRIRGSQSEYEAHLEQLDSFGSKTLVAQGRAVDPLPEELAALAREHDLGERRVDQILGLKSLTGWPIFIGTVIFGALSIGIFVWMFNFISSYPTIFDWFSIFYTVLKFCSFFALGAFFLIGFLQII